MSHRERHGGLGGVPLRFEVVAAILAALVGLGFMSQPNHERDGRR